MTTRRRRAGSDSNSIEIGDSEHLPHEPPLPGQPAVINPLFSVPVINPAVVPGSVLVPNFGIARQPSALQQEAYYKKTDNSPLPSKQFAPRTFTPQNSAFHNSLNSSSQSSNSSFVSNFQGLSGGISNYFNTALIPSSQTASHLTHPAPDSDSTGELEIPRLGRLNGLDGIEETSVMAFRDRTSEFSGIIKKSQQQGPHGYSNGVLKGPANKGHRDLSQYSNFMKHSRMVGRNISSTYAKLEKLTLLAKKRSLFDDSQDLEVQELTAIIRHDLTSLTKQLEDLRRSSSASSASSTSHMQKHSANLVGSLQTKVATITQKFRDVLEVRTENLKKQAERRDQFTGGSSSSALLPVAGGGSAHPASVLLADEAKANAAARRSAGGGGGRSNGDVVLDFDGISVPQSNPGSYQQQLQLIEEQDSLLQSRAETMKTIESTIVELGTMFTQLAAMVKEQDELVHRIDANVDDAEMNVEAAHTELLKYFRSVSSNRWLMFKVFGIVIAFFIIFVVFMA